MVIGIVILSIACGAIVGAGFFFLKSQKTRNWPKVEGVITKSSTRIQREPGTSGAPTTIADVWYTFVIDGIKYQNDTISLAQYGSSSASHAVKEAHKYPVGSRVMVYYNPENYYDSVLEHKTPWVFIGIFAGLGSLLFYIGIGMLSGSFRTNYHTAPRLRAKHESTHAYVAAHPGRKWVMIFVIITSMLITGLIFYFFFNDKAANHKDFRQADNFQPEPYQPQLVSTYSNTATSHPCKEWLKPNIAESQKIDLKDNLHTLYVTAILCINEEEMIADIQSRQTWPIIAQHLATYDKNIFNPEHTLLLSDGVRTYPEFENRLMRIEQECLEKLHNNGIFFVKEIKFQLLRVFIEN